MRTHHIASAIMTTLSFLAGCEAKKATHKAVAQKAAGKIGIDIINGVVSGGVEGAIGLIVGQGAKFKLGRRVNSVPDQHALRRDDTPWQAPPGVPQYNFDMCADALSTTVVQVQGPVSNNGITFDAVPSTCMVLASVIDGDPEGGPVPTPCGSACLLYDNLSARDYEDMRGIWQEYPKAN